MHFLNVLLLLDNERPNEQTCSAVYQPWSDSVLLAAVLQSEDHTSIWTDGSDGDIWRQVYMLCNVLQLTS